MTTTFKQDSLGLVNKTPAKHRDIFRDTLIAKNGEGKVLTHDLLAGKQKNFKHQPGTNNGQVRTQDLQPD